MFLFCFQVNAAKNYTLPVAGSSRYPAKNKARRAEPPPPHPASPPAFPLLSYDGVWKSTKF